MSTKLPPSPLAVRLAALALAALVGVVVPATQLLLADRYEQQALASARQVPALAQAASATAPVR